MPETWVPVNVPLEDKKPRSRFQTRDEAVDYWVAQLAKKPTTNRDRERLISLLLD